VSDPAVDTRPGGTSWRVANIVLIVVALILVATTVLFFTKGAAATPGASKAERLSREYKQVSAAAKAETLAFLTVDYKDMDPLIAKVLEGATGNFKTQYNQAKVTLKASAEQSKATSTGKVLTVGISDIDDTDAVVFVAANSQVTNASTKGKPQPRYYRLKLTMLRKGDTWLTSNLQFVG
jgi:Mce-associated membrane protein